MVDSLMAKLFGDVMESMLNVWVEDHDKKVYEQVGF
jgi:hypothetical protein